MQFLKTQDSIYFTFDGIDIRFKEMHSLNVNGPIEAKDELFWNSIFLMIYIY